MNFLFLFCDKFYAKQTKCSVVLSKRWNFYSFFVYYMQRGHALSFNNPIKAEIFYDFMAVLNAIKI